MSKQQSELQRRTGTEGAVMIMVAAAIVMLLSFAAIGIDLAMVATTRTQLQNAADAAALAAASGLATGSQSEARSRAMAFAAYNSAVQINQSPVIIQPSDVTFPASNEVQVVTHRTNATGDPVRTHFLLLLFPNGTNTTDVRARATARVTKVCATDCVKPWAIPDRWNDTIANGIYDVGEAYDPVGTGYVAPQDVGVRVVLKAGTGQAIAPGQYYPVDFPPLGYGQNPLTGGSYYRDWIASCAPYPVAIGDSLQLEPGNMVGPTTQGAADLVALDPGAYWDAGSKSVRGSAFGVSPRTVIVPFFDPRFPPQSGRNYVRISKIGAFFIEGIGTGNGVIGRFMQLAVPGTPCAAGAPTGGFLTSYALIR